MNSIDLITDFVTFSDFDDYIYEDANFALSDGVDFLMKNEGLSRGDAKTRFKDIAKEKGGVIQAMEYLLGKDYYVKSDAIADPHPDYQRYAARHARRLTGKISADAQAQRKALARYNSRPNPDKREIKGLRHKVKVLERAANNEPQIDIDAIKDESYERGRQSVSEALRAAEANANEYQKDYKDAMTKIEALNKEKEDILAKHAGELADSRDKGYDLGRLSLSGDLNAAEANANKYQKDYRDVKSAFEAYKNRGLKQKIIDTWRSGTKGKLAIGGAAAGTVAVGTLAGLGIAGARGVGPMASDSAKAKRVDRLMAEGKTAKAMQIANSIKDERIRGALLSQYAAPALPAPTAY